jgi:hypothetical protein
LSGIDWMETPLEDFLSVDERQPDGTYTVRPYPFGDGVAQSLMMRLAAEVQNAYSELIAPEDDERFEVQGRVPVIRDGQKGYEPLETLMLKDLPVVLETLVVLEEEHKQREGEEAERMAEERKARRRVRDRERRQRKKLGEW